MKISLYGIVIAALLGCQVVHPSWGSLNNQATEDFLGVVADENTYLYGWKVVDDIADAEVKHILGKADVESVVYEFDFILDESNRVFLVDVSENGNEFFTGLEEVKDSRVIKKLNEATRIINRNEK